MTRSRFRAMARALSLMRRSRRRTIGRCRQLPRRQTLSDRWLAVAIDGDRERRPVDPSDEADALATTNDRHDSRSIGPHGDQTESSTTPLASMSTTAAYGLASSGRIAAPPTGPSLRDLVDARSLPLGDQGERFPPGARSTSCRGHPGSSGSWFGESRRNHQTGAALAPRWRHRPSQNRSPGRPPATAARERCRHHHEAQLD